MHFPRGTDCAGRGCQPGRLEDAGANPHRNADCLVAPRAPVHVLVAGEEPRAHCDGSAGGDCSCGPARGGRGNAAGGGFVRRFVCAHSVDPAIRAGDLTMDRTRMIAALADRSARWDIIVIGGGATGLGCAVDAASRGYRTVLLEQSDFAKGTSSRSTKLIHGGVRYLKQGNLKLVRESLRERALLLQNAPELVKLIPFVLPNYAWWERPYYGIGLKLYSLLSRQTGTKHLSRGQVLERLPTLRADHLRGGIEYVDGQFDDAR